MTALRFFVFRHEHLPAAAMLAIVVLAGSLPAMGQSNGDLQRLAGTWHVASEQFKGQERSSQDLLDSKSVLKVTGSKFVFEIQPPNGKKAIHTGTVMLDESVKPKRFDWKGTGPKGASLERIGLYELTEKEFKLVYVQRLSKKGDPVSRPADFRHS
jgi:uncharacterized protein (TIGR03067 family)